MLNSRLEPEFDEFPKAFPVSVTEIVGILLATGGMYFALTERASSGNSPVEKETSGGESSAKFSIPRSAVFQSAIFAGLAILGLSHSSCPELLPRSMLADGMRGIVFGQEPALFLQELSELSFRRPPVPLYSLQRFSERVVRPCWAFPEMLSSAAFYSPVPLCAAGGFTQVLKAGRQRIIRNQAIGKTTKQPSNEH